ncbi:FecR family protein [Pedobacter sp. UBA5917]|uniref:FecR family protein n=1 Tax=Pedobacter sp. UBA5917 TaxID=1947061 RepID=UPI0025ED4974|nr:FecR family protein [Pedobacter sp. UBA5917]
MNTEEIKYLLKKYNDQTASPQEKKLIEEWYEHVNGEELQPSEFSETEIKSQSFSNIQSRIKAHANVKKPKQIKLFSAWFFRAAIVLITLSAGLYLYLKQTESNVPVIISKVNKTEIIPGGDNAILSLADGSKVVLNKTADGQIADQSGVKIIKTKSGELLYRFVGDPNASATAMNTVSTPRGGQYHLILADGTEVWLNAASSVKFPAAFAGNERKVEVTGEVYFEVSKNKAKPFIVHTDQSDIKVLGTHFNVNTYDDEEYQRTTLLEGSIEMKTGNQKVLLTPGQQANIGGKSGAIKIREIDDLEAVIGWTNGYFQFEKSDLQSVMRQVSRWYNTTVNYNGTIPAKQYTGKIPRSVNVAKLIEMLSYTGIHCSVEHNEITVNPR